MSPAISPVTSVACFSALFLSASVFGHNVALRLLLLFAALVCVAYTIARERDSIRFLPPMWLPFALWAAWAALSVMWSLEPERTIKEFRNEVFYTAAALWICYVGAQARTATHFFLPLVAASGLIASAIALRDFGYGPHYYMQGWHGGPGDHSSALLTLMPCVVMAGWFASRAGRRWRILLGSLALAGVFFASAYTTLNRTIWFGFIVQFVLVGALLLARARRSATAPAGSSIRLIATIAAIAIVSGASVVLMNVQVERQAIGAAHELERDGRLALWPEIAERIAERPLTGYGFGRGLLRESLQKEFRSLDEHLWHAHNIFLEALLQTGVPGLALLLLLLGAIAREGWRFARNADDGAAACGIALLGVVAGMLVRNMTDTLLVRQNALLFWGVVGVLLALGTRPWRASS